MNIRGMEPRRWVGPAAIAAVGVAMCAWTWRAWPDLIIDFGRELYLAWRLSEGEVLYRDIAHFFGPLPPYVNALWFRIFGVSLATLAFANLALLALLTGLLYRLLTAAGDRFSATVACVVFLTLFAFAQLLATGNYNYVTPYSHGLTHGMIFSLAGLGAVAVYGERRNPGWLAFAGLTLGLTFLSKIEVFLAAALGIVGAGSVALWAERPPARRTVRLILVFTAGAVVPVAAASLLLMTAIPNHLALQGISSEAAMLTHRDITSQAFYRWGQGFEDPIGNGWKMLKWLGGYLLVLLPVAAIAFALRKPGQQRPVVAGWLFAGTVVVIGLVLTRSTWYELARPLPLAVAIFIPLAVRRGLGLRGRSPGLRGILLQVGLLIFALGLLAKMILNTRIHHYGFALAMPATLVTVVALVGWIPSYIDRAGGYGNAFRACALAVLTVVVVGHLGVTSRQFASKTLLVGRGADAIRADSIRGPVVAEFLQTAQQRLGPGRTLAVLPEGVMLNFLLRRPTSVPYTNLVPLQVILYGEERILEAFQAAPPDFVALVHRETSEYGFTFFGRDYGRKLFQWIDGHYRPVMRFGDPPLMEGSEFGIDLLELVSAEPAPASMPE